MLINEHKSLIWIPLLPGRSPGWLCIAHVWSLVPPVSGSSSAQAFQTQMQNITLTTGQCIWNEDSQTNGAAIRWVAHIFMRPGLGRPGPGSPKPLAFLPTCTISWMKLWELFKCWGLLHSFSISKNESGSKLVFKLYTLYVGQCRCLSLFTEVTFCNVATSADWVNTEPGLPNEVQG